jgi:hypothetical protein
VIFHGLYYNVYCLQASGDNLYLNMREIHDTLEVMQAIAILNQEQETLTTDALSRKASVKNDAKLSVM